MTPNAASGSTQTITVTDGVAFTVNAPTNPVSGQRLALVFINTSGGAMGAATFNGTFHLAGAFTAPATANRRRYEFEYNGSFWEETFRSPADIAN